MPTTRHPAQGASRWTAAALLVLLLAAAGTAGAVPLPQAPGPLPQAPGPGPAESGRPTLAGRPLTEALLALRSLGLEIVFTSQLVRPEMRVLAEPSGSDPRLLLDQILAPHGLRAMQSSGGILVVVPAPAAAESAEGSIGGGVSDPGSLEPPARAYLREEIVVRSSRLSLLDQEPPAPLSLSREDIDALPHLAGDLFRALSLLPGTTANDFTAQIHVHGGRRDEVQVVLDGQELYEAHHLYDYDRALSIVEPGALSGAAFSTGAFPARHGDRMSGVLDLTTAVPSGPRRARLSLSLVTAVASGGGTFRDERGTWLATARRGSIDLASRLLGKEDPDFWDLFGKVSYELDDRQSLRGHLLHAGDTLDFAESVRGERKLFDTDYDSSYLWLTHQALSGERLLAETTASWSELDRDRHGAEDEEDQSFDIADRRAAEIFGLGHSSSFQATPRHTLSGGVEGRRYEVDYDYARDLEADLVLAPDLSPPPVFHFTGRRIGDHLGIWAADRFSPLRPLTPLTIELGLRYDRHTLTGDTLASPRVNLAWRLSETSVVRASWGHFHQSQRPYELQVEDGESRFHSAERSVHSVLGYERLFRGGKRSLLEALRLEAYRRQIDDPRPRYENLFEPLNVFPEIEPDRVRLAPGSSRAQGVELTLRGAAGARTDWWANYARASARDRFGGREVRRQTDQTDTLNLYVDTRLGRSWNLSVAWRYHTGWPTTPVSLVEVPGDPGGNAGADEEGEEGEEPEGPEEPSGEEPRLVPVLGPLYSERLPSYHRLDLRASRAWQLRAGRLTFFLDLQNVYDRKNQAGFDIAFDAEEGELDVEREDWPGFFPSLGISWEM
jgi:TonB dependent receptor